MRTPLATIAFRLWLAGVAVVVAALALGSIVASGFSSSQPGSWFGLLWPGYASLAALPLELAALVAAIFSLSTPALEKPLRNRAILTIVLAMLTALVLLPVAVLTLSVVHG